MNYILKVTISHYSHTSIPYQGYIIGYIMVYNWYIFCIGNNNNVYIRLKYRKNYNLRRTLLLLYLR